MANKLEKSLACLCGAAMAGIKPSSLAVCRRSDGRELAQYARAFQKKGIRIEPLAVRGGKIIYLVFRENKLREHLLREDSMRFLQRYGYPAGSFGGCIGFLKLRLLGSCFPHEIGIFLGYPEEDIAGYIEDPCGCIFSGAWKVYADPEKKRALFEKYKRCSGCILRRLAAGDSLIQIFR